MSKYLKDRKILKKVDTEAAQQSLPDLLGYLAIFAILIFPGDIYLDFPKFTVSVGIGLISLALARGWFVLRFEQEYGRGPARWRRMFVALNYLNHALWACLVMLVVWFYGLSINTFITSIFTLGLSAVSVLTWSAYRWVNKTCLSLSLLPMMVAFFSLNTVHSYVTGIMLLAFYVVLVRQANYLYNRFWERVETNEELKTKARDLEISKTRAEQASTVKMDFLANLTHEIRTPMNSVMGMLSLMGDTELSEEQHEFQQVASHSGEALLNLIDDILDFSQLSAGKVVMESAVFNLRKCIEETLELHGPVAHAKGVELSCVYDPDIPLRVRGDPARLNQVISNLVSNAIKFSDGGEVIVEVHMTRLANNEGLLRVHVIDNGIGISKDQHDQLFEGFSMLDGSTTRKNTGTGLGLAICKGLVDCMGGQIGLVSELGKGSNFWFTVKMRLSTQQAQHAFNQRSLDEVRALIVNAQEGCVRGLVHELESWGIQTEAINDYDKALQVLRASIREQCGYDLVIMDLGLTYQNSLKLSRIIAEDPLLKDTKQILLTTLVQRGSNDCLFHRRKVENLEFVTKPVARNGLWHALGRLFDLQPVTAREKKLYKVEPSNTENLFSVLLVEDNKVNQMVAKGMLKRLGYAVKVVNNGKEALGIVSDKKFDLILMDCLMPEMDGYETTQAIRERELQTGQRIPIIAMTANAMEGEEAKCLAAGMDDYLSKPVNVDELNTKLKRWLDSSTQNDTGIIDTHAQNRAVR